MLHGSQATGIGDDGAGALLSWSGKDTLTSFLVVHAITSSQICDTELVAESPTSAGFSAPSRLIQTIPLELGEPTDLPITVVETIRISELSTVILPTGKPQTGITIFQGFVFHTRMPLHWLCPPDGHSVTV